MPPGTATNAAQALAENGGAGIIVSSEGAGVRVEIWDSGLGIPAERIDKVFDPFFSTRRDGTGLGLSIARQIVHAHGGTITIASQQDFGTTISVCLPLAT